MGLLRKIFVFVAGTCLGILANDGIVLAAEKRNVHKLLDEVFLSDKIYVLDDNIACSVAGITSDANVLITDLRKIAQRFSFVLNCLQIDLLSDVFNTSPLNKFLFRYKLSYQESIPVEQLVVHLCDIKQAYTQFGGMFFSKYL